MTKCKELIASSDATDYFIIKEESSPNVFYGILAQTKDDSTDSDKVKNFFFTRGEAEECCFWLAENDVYPCVLKNVIADRYYAY